MVETDIANCFEAIPHDRLMSAIEERIVDRHVLKLLRAMLRAGVMEDGRGPAQRDRHSAGRGDLALLCNVYLHRLDRQWPTRGTGVLVRYADDLLVMCQHRAGGRARPRGALGRSWPSWALSSSRPRRGSCTCAREARGSTSSASITAGCAAASPRIRHLTFLARWPSRQAMQHARDRIRELTARERLLLAGRRGRAGLNRFLRGWAGYFRYGNSARHFDQITHHALDRLALFVAKRHQTAVALGPVETPLSPERARADQPRRNRRRAPAQPAVAAGTLNAGGEERR